MKGLARFSAPSGKRASAQGRLERTLGRKVSWFLLPPD